MDILSNPITKTNLAANRVYASPNLASGNAVFRQLTGDDLPLITGVTTITPAYNDSLLIGDASPSQNGSAAISTVLSLALQGFIFGLEIEWVSATQLKLKTGAAHIQNGDVIVKLAADSTKTISGLSASTWYHVYVFQSGGALDWEHSTTAPAAPYFGTASSLAGNTGRRYVGSFRTNASSQIVNFVSFGSGSNIDVRYRNAVDLENRFLSNANATTNTTISSTTSFIPVTANRIGVRMTNLATAGFVYFDSGELNPAAGQGHYGLGVNSVDGAYLLLNSSAQFRYSYSSTPSGSNFLYMETTGFVYSR